MFDGAVITSSQTVGVNAGGMDKGELYSGMAAMKETVGKEHSGVKSVAGSLQKGGMSGGAHKDAIDVSNVIHANGGKGGHER